MSKAVLIHPEITARPCAERSQMLLLESEDRARWERFVAESPRGHLLQCWAWGELKRGAGWSPLRVALWDAAEARLLAGAQVLLRPIPLTGYALAYIPRGPVIDWADAALCETFFTALHALLRARRVAVLRIEPDVPEHIAPPGWQQGAQSATLSGSLSGTVQGHAVVQGLAALGFCGTRDRVQQPRTIVVDLTPDEQTIRQRQKPKWRYNTGLAARKGVTIRPAEGVEDARRWYDLLEITRERDRFAGHTFAYYRRAWELLSAAGQARLLLAEHAGKLLAGVFVTRVGTQGMYLYGASSDEERHLMPNHLLQWEAMRWAKAQGATHYDLWGIADTDDPTHPEAGLTFFKRGWGGQVVTHIGAFDAVYAPMAYRLFLGGRELMQQITALRAYLRRRVPLP